MVDNLQPVFAGALPVFASDAPGVLDPIADRGVDVLPLDDMVAARPANAVIVVQDMDTMRRRHREIRDAMAESRVLLVPTCSFDPSPRTVAYTLDVLFTSDFERAVARNRAWRDVMMRHPSPLVFRRPDQPGVELRCELLGDVKVSAREHVALDVGEWRSVAAFFEVEMEVFDAKPHYFSLEGELVVDGVLAAKSSRMAADCEHLHDAMNDLIAELGGKPGTMVAAANRLESIVVDGREIVEEVTKFTAGRYDRHFVEFAVGTNSPGCPVDWSLNSLLNEGVAGVHVAVGDGIGGAHVDLVSAGTRLVLE